MQCSKPDLDITYNGFTPEFNTGEVIQELTVIQILLQSIFSCKHFGSLRYFAMLKPGNPKKFCFVIAFIVLNIFTQLF